MTTANYLESLQNDLNTIVNTLELDEGSNFSDIAQMTTEGEISKGGGSEYTGHYDATGLAQLGWTSDDINYYQDNGVYWNAEQDNDYKVTNNEIQGTAGTRTRFIPKNSTLTTFRNYYALIGIPALNINKQDWSETFRGCYCLITIPLLSTGNATTMQSMFNNCSNLKKVPLLNTSNVTTMQNMFTSCSSLLTIPLFNTSKLTSMRSMFSNCYALRSIPLIDTSRVTNMYYCFQNCYGLTSIPELNTSSVTEMGGMFSYCYNLSDESLNNILKMCINATSYTGTKTLSTIGIDSTTYSNRITSLSNYNDFINAGWQA